MSLRQFLKMVLTTAIVVTVGCKSTNRAKLSANADRGSLSAKIEPQFYPIEGPADPIYRNRKTTQSYYYAAESLNKILTRHDPGFDFQANWLHFAIWASLRVGETLDGTDLQTVTTAKDFIFDYMDQSLSWISAGTRSSYIDDLRKSHDPMKTIQKIVNQSLIDGNQLVASEIMSITERYIRMLGCDSEYDEAKFSEFMDTFKYDHDRDAPFQVLWEHMLAAAPTLSKGDKYAGGQDALARAFATYHKSRFEEDPLIRAQMILYGSLLIAFHEQLLLQTYISGAIGILDPQSSIYRKVATVLAVDLGLPDNGFTGVSRPGVGLKRYPVRQSLSARNFSQRLAALRFPPLIEMAQITSLDKNWGRGATDWKDYQSRMYFIAGLMRTAQSNVLIASYPFAGPHADLNLECR